MSLQPMIYKKKSSSYCWLVKLMSNNSISLFGVFIYKLSPTKEAASVKLVLMHSSFRVIAGGS